MSTKINAELLNTCKNLRQCLWITQLLMADAKLRALAREVCESADEVIALAEGEEVERERV